MRPACLRGSRNAHAYKQTYILILGQVARLTGLGVDMRTEVTCWGLPLYRLMHTQKQVHPAMLFVRGLTAASDALVPCALPPGVFMEVIPQYRTTFLPHCNPAPATYRTSLSPSPCVSPPGVAMEVIPRTLAQNCHAV